MAIWWLLPAFVGLVGVLMLVGGVARVFKAQLGGGIMRVLFGGLTLAGAAIIGLVGPQPADLRPALQGMGGRHRHHQEGRDRA